MQMCTCSAGVTNATYSGSGQIRLRGGNNSGKLVFNIKLPAQVHLVVGMVLYMLVQRQKATYAKH